MRISRLKKRIESFAGRLLNGPDVVRKDGLVTWGSRDDYQWGGGSTPEEISAITYWAVSDLRTALEGQQFDSAVEIGAGYGRITPWLSLFAHDVTAVEPNEGPRDDIETQYPQIETIDARAQNLPLESNSHDLVFTRSVLQHVPPSEFPEVCTELQRILADDGTAVLMEDTEGHESDVHFPRSVQQYENAFTEWSITDLWPRTAPTAESTHPKSVMVFKVD